MEIDFLIKTAYIEVDLDLSNMSDEDLVTFYDDYIGSAEHSGDRNQMIIDITDTIRENVNFGEDEFDSWTGRMPENREYGLYLSNIDNYSDMLRDCEVWFSDINSYDDLAKLYSNSEELNQSTFNKFLEKSYEDYYITEYYTGHGWLFSDGTFLSQSGVDHRLVAPYDEWHSRGIVTLISGSSNSMNVRLLDNMSGVQINNLESLIEEIKPDIIYYDVYSEGMNIINSGSVDYYEFEGVRSLIH